MKKVDSLIQRRACLGAKTVLSIVLVVNIILIVMAGTLIVQHADIQILTSSAMAPFTLGGDGKTTVTQDLESRHKNVESSCLNISNQYPETGNIGLKLLYKKQRNVLFCNIPKTASSTIRRILLYVDNEEKYTSPADIPFNDLEKYKSHPPVANISDLNRLWGNSFKFLFVRDPYYRLFSGYVDKLFNVNQYYWNVIGRAGIKRFRKEPSLESLNCGHDLKFSELVKYVISGNPKHLDPHFRPMHQQCFPCSIKYDVIGKVETFKQDMKYIWSTLDQKKKINSSFPEVDDQFHIKDIKDKVNLLFSSKKRLSTCLGFFNSMTRIWKVFQSRGVIDCDISMPFNESHSKNLTKAEFQDAILEAKGSSGNNQHRQKCKEEAVVEAYSTVPMEDLESLQRLFAPDCELFGYETRPQYVFDKEYIKYNKHNFFNVP